MAPGLVHIGCPIRIEYEQFLSRGEIHFIVHRAFINSMKAPNETTFILLLPASTHFMF